MKLSAPVSILWQTRADLSSGKKGGATLSPLLEREQPELLFTSPVPFQNADLIPERDALM